MDQASLKLLGIPLLAWIPLLPLIGAFINLTLGRRFSRGTVQTIAIASVAFACGLTMYLVWGPLWKEFKAGNGGTGIAQTVWTWIEVGQFKVEMAFRLDTLSAVMIMIVTFVGTLIHIYSTGYMSHEPRYAAYFGYLNLFTGSMLVLVLGSNMPVMFIGWEGVGLCSFLLIGFWYERDDYAYAGRKAFVVNRIGDFSFLLGMFLLFWATKDMNLPGGSLDFQALESPLAQSRYIADYHCSVNTGSPCFWGSERLAAAAGILLFIGACGKSAQLPLYVWLPDAMAGPTPVSALIHAATMVTAGVYMICRLSFLYASSTTALAVVAIVGMLTALAAAFMAFAQTDLKKVLAYSTVSQLGFMFVAAGTGNWVAAVFHLGTHAFFKACLFLGAGSVMHGMEHGGSHTPGDITTMGGLRKQMPITRLTFMISCLAIAGIAPFSGFFSKDEILAGAWNVHPPGWPPFLGKLLWAGLLIAALGTAFYMWRLYFLVFGGENRTKEAEHAHESAPSMTIPLLVLAGLATVAGFIGFPHLTNTKLPGVLHGLSSWLAPSVAHVWNNPTTAGAPPQPIMGHASDSTTFLLMGVALAVGALGIGLAYVLYGKGPTRSVAKLVDGPLQGAYQASKHKLWVDEIYDRVFVRPFKWAAVGLYEIADRWVIDGIGVNGSALAVSVSSRVARWFQNGQVQRYLTGVVIGAALVFFVTSWEHEPSFDIVDEGEFWVLRAQPGAGIVGANAKVKWDINGDGVADEDPEKRGSGAVLEGTEVRIRKGMDATGPFTLILEDPVSHKTQKITRNLPAAAPTTGAGSQK